MLKFKLTGSVTERSLVLVSEDPANISNVTAFAARKFVDYGAADNQGDYLIITNKILMTGDNGADQYRQYRGSAAGGNFRAKLYDIDELVDQFAFGIKKHPQSIKNFLAYARNAYTVQPKYVLLLGKAVTYNDYRANESSPFAARLNLVPTFGWPASDVILASNTLEPVAATPIGRLSVISSEEIGIYLTTN